MQNLPLKILFLDIDGVVNSRQTFERMPSKILGINQELADLIRKIQAKTGCAIVLSSTWRLSEDSRQVVREEVGEFIDVTPRSISGFRGNEIRAWLQDHPEVTHYAILDDDGDFYKYQPLFQTSFNYGLTPEIAEQVIKHFK